MLIVIALTASARWETVMWDGKPMTSTLTIYRSDHNTTTKFIYDYRDSTFHVQFYPEARVLAKFKNYMDITRGSGVIPWQGYPKMIDKR